MNTGISAINDAVQEGGAFLRPLFNEIGKVIVGQTYLVERLVIGLLANGHVLLEGVPGLAKTLSVKSLEFAFQKLDFACSMSRAIWTRSSSREVNFFSSRSFSTKASSSS